MEPRDHWIQQQQCFTHTQKHLRKARGMFLYLLGIAECRLALHSSWGGDFKGRFKVLLNNTGLEKCQPATLREKSPKICISEVLALLKLFFPILFSSSGACVSYSSPEYVFTRLLFSHRSLKRKSTAVSSSLLYISHPLSGIFIRNAFPLLKSVPNMWMVKSPGQGCRLYLLDLYSLYWVSTK